jgi:hypothetical protein
MTSWECGERRGLKWAPWFSAPHLIGSYKLHGLLVSFGGIDRTVENSEFRTLQKAGPGATIFGLEASSAAILYNHPEKSDYLI